MSGELLPIEEQISLRRVAITVAFTIQETERYQRIKKIAVSRGCNPTRSRRDSRFRGPCASCVKTPNSTADSRVFAGQKAIPVCRIFSGVSLLSIVAPDERKLIKLITWNYIRCADARVAGQAAGSSHNHANLQSCELNSKTF